MTKKDNLKNWIIEALKNHDGTASIVEICKFVWDNYEVDLRDSGDLFYTWQYDIRWQATNLRKSGVLLSAEVSPQGIWELA